MKALTFDLRKFLILLLLAIIISILDIRNLLFYPKSWLQTITTPVQYGLYKTSNIFIHQFDFLIKARTAAKEEKALREQLAQVLSENANLRRKLGELQAYENQYQALNPATFNLLPSRPVAFSRFLKIDKGSQDGVKVNQAVVYKDNLIGQVKVVSSKQSEVLLITDPQSRVAVFVSGEEGRAKGILSGEFGAEMLMDKILHGESIKEKDLVYSEGTEGSFPRGLILGQVVKVDDRANEIFKQARVKPVFDLGELDLVFVIIE